MDPLSIAAGCASLATVCYKVSASLYVYIQDVKAVDEEVQRLNEEVQSLAHILGSVEKAWKSHLIVAQAQAEENKSLWNDVNNTLEACKASLETLCAKLQSLDPKKSFMKGFLRRERKQIRFGLGSDEIASLRQRIQAYHGGIGIALNVFNISIQVRGFANQDHRDARILLQLDDLRARIESTDKTLKGLALYPRSQSLGSNTQEVSEVVELVKSAESFYSSASTVIGGQNNAALEIGSVHGVPLGRKKENQIKAWASQSSTMTLEEVSAQSVQSGTDAVMDPDRKTLMEDLDPDSESDADVMERFKDVAMSKYKKRDYVAAETLLRKAIVRFENPSIESTAVAIYDLKLTLAGACTAQRKFAEAEIVLKTLVSVLNKDDIRMYKAMHMLAMLYCEKKDFELASKYSNRALKGGKRLLGGEDETYLSFVVMFVLICRSAGEHAEADVYESLLPENWRKPVTDLPKLEPAFIAEGIAIDLALEEIVRFCRQREYDAASSHADTYLGKYLHDPDLARENNRKRLEHIMRDSERKPFSALQKPLAGMFGKFALMQCARNNQVDFARCLLEKGVLLQEEVQIDEGVQINLHSDGSCTTTSIYSPIDEAARNGSIEMVQLLIEHGAEYQETIYEAANQGKDDVVLYLMGLMDPIDQNFKLASLLSSASKACRVATVNRLIDKTLDHLGSVRDQRAVTVLIYAAENRYETAVWPVLEKKVDIDKALFEAVKLGLATAVRSLIEKGAKAPKKRLGLLKQQEEDMLFHAASTGSEQTVRVLLQKGADPNTTDSEKITTLHHASLNGQDKIAQALLEMGADVNRKSKSGFTPLAAAAHNGHESTVRLLLAAGADIHAETNFPGSALHFAAYKGWENIVQLLLKEGASVDRYNHESQTALHIAAAQGHERVVRLLLQEGAYKHPVDGHIRYPQDLAREHGHKAVEKLLDSWC